MVTERAAAAFWKHVTPGQPNECWLWQGSVQASGYGNSWDGTAVVTAHRVSYQIHHGEIPAGRDVMHTCDVPACVNPAHLRAGTRSENMVDAGAKGRLRGRPFHARRDEKGRWST